MMRYSVVLFLLFAFAKAQLSTAQKSNRPKVERHERIDVQKFPKNARELVKIISKSRKKVKYYKETDGYLTTYEAKYKFDGLKYSVECDTIGNIIDIEVLIKKRKMNERSRDAIEVTLEKVAKRFRIEKVQQQYVIEKQDATHILERIHQKDYDNYELIVAFKENRKIYRKEMLFNREGVLLKQRDVKRIAYDFLLF